MLKTPGIYIVVIWNTSDINSALHGVAVEVKDDGTMKAYNNDTDSLNTDSYTEDIFVTGYRVSRK
jgi:hypothetical protein